MKLLTKALEVKFPRICATEKIPERDRRIVCKFFSLGSGWIFYAVEGERDATGDFQFFGLIDGPERVWGYEHLSGMESIGIAFHSKTHGLTHSGTIPAVERDLYFGNHTIGEVMDGLVR